MVVDDVEDLEIFLEIEYDLDKDTLNDGAYHKDLLVDILISVRES